MHLHFLCAPVQAVKLISQAVRRNASLTALNGVGNKSAVYSKALPPPMEPPPLTTHVAVT